MRIIVTTSNKYVNRAFPAFAYLFNKYWPCVADVTVIGESPPDKPLPHNFSFVSVNINGEGWPADKYSDGMIWFIRNHVRDECIMWLLDDYWLNTLADCDEIKSLAEYITMSTTEILRIDLTSDRWMSGHAKELGRWGKYTLIETPPTTPYQMSLQAGIWKRDLLLQVLQYGWSPWQVELVGTSVLNERDDIRVLGTSNHPLKYTNAFNNSIEGTNTDGLANEDIEHMKGNGWI